jgi:hypothetical protein
LCRYFRASMAVGVLGPWQDREITAIDRQYHHVARVDEKGRLTLEYPRGQCFASVEKDSEDLGELRFSDIVI